jgi:uncharacterized small protein (DUF1192 family)
MSGKNLVQRWDQAAAERAAKEKELDMPGVQDARARIGKLAAEIQADKKERAEENARKKAVKLQEAQELRKIWRDLALLSVSDKWGPRAQAWGQDKTMIKQRS